MGRKKKRRAVNAMKAYEPIALPHHVMRILPDQCKFIDVYGDMASLGEDYVSLEEMQEALDWLVDQFGGKVDWT